MINQKTGFCRDKNRDGGVGCGCGDSENLQRKRRRRPGKIAIRFVDFTSGDALGVVDVSDI